MPFANPPIDPWPVVDGWLTEAHAHPDIPYADAACLSTVADDGGADGRIVLAERPPDQQAFVLLTDTKSPKALQLRAQPAASLTFYWPALERQLRVRGLVQPGDETLANRLFEQRPRPSRTTAWVSRQSQPFAIDDPLDQRVTDADRRFADIEPIPRPDRWQAFIFEAQTFELWQAGARRLHRRLRYQRQADGRWHSERLEP